MRDAPFALDDAAARYLAKWLDVPACPNEGLAICLATVEHESTFHAHSIELVGLDDEQVSECELFSVMGRRLWIRTVEAKLLAGKELTVIEAGSPEKRLRLVIKGITERELRVKLLGGA